MTTPVLARRRTLVVRRGLYDGGHVVVHRSGSLRGELCTSLTPTPDRPVRPSAPRTPGCQIAESLLTQRGADLGAVASIFAGWVRFSPAGLSRDGRAGRVPAVFWRRCRHVRGCIPNARQARSTPILGTHSSIAWFTVCSYSVRRSCGTLPPTAPIPIPALRSARGRCRASPPTWRPQP